MTREQAINYLFSSGFTNEQVGEVVRALTYEPTTKNDLGVDCIKKSDAINIIQDMHGLARADVISDAVNRIITMTSVTQQPTKNYLGVDAVNRKAVLDVIEREQFKGDAISEIEKLPLVTPQEPRKGHWIADVDRWGDLVTTVNGYKCDKCNAFNSDKDNFCPNCGADMRGEK